MPYLPRRKSNAGDMECEKCGLAAPLGRRSPWSRCLSWINVAHASDKGGFPGTPQPGFHERPAAPHVDAAGDLVGIITEGDFLRRIETGTLRRRPRWIEFFVGPGRLAEEYAYRSTPTA